MSIIPLHKDKPTNITIVQPTDPNYDNRVRTHLANQRTYLAWVKTALTTLALAVAILHFGAGSAMGVDLRYAGFAFFTVSSFACIFIGAKNYHHLKEELNKR